MAAPLLVFNGRHKDMALGGGTTAPIWIMVATLLLARNSTSGFYMGSALFVGPLSACT
jgi:hypothetical protein